MGRRVIPAKYIFIKFNYSFQKIHARYDEILRLLAFHCLILNLHFLFANVFSFACSSKYIDTSLHWFYNFICSILISSSPDSIILLYSCLCRIIHIVLILFSLDHTHVCVFIIFILPPSSSICAFSYCPFLFIHNFKTCLSIFFLYFHLSSSSTSESIVRAKPNLKLFY